MICSSTEAHIYMKPTFPLLTETLNTFNLYNLKCKKKKKVKSFHCRFTLPDHWKMVLNLLCLNVVRNSCIFNNTVYMCYLQTSVDWGQAKSYFVKQMYDVFCGTTIILVVFFAGFWSKEHKPAELQLQIRSSDVVLLSWMPYVCGQHSVNRHLISFITII